MAVKREHVGEAKNGEPVYAYHLTNRTGMRVTVLNLGATLRDIVVPAKDGKQVDVCLGQANLEEYYRNRGNLGAVVGPVANRTANARYTIDGVEYSLPVNENENNLHSDDEVYGFQRKVWAAKESENEVTFSISVPDGELGCPGNREVSVTYSLSDKNELSLHYHATSDRNTALNLTNHVYFNLRGHDAGSITDHIMQIFASHYLPVVPGAIPTGELAPVAGTPMDFTSPKEIGREIDADFEQLKLVKGYDHNYCVDDADGTLREVAVTSCPATGITMHTLSDLPGVQFYAGNALKTPKAKDGGSYGMREGFCLETQYFPNSLNQQGFARPVFGPDRELDTTTVYRFD
ncbi:MAG: galactose mutarotase [Lachnospiraceae bacterium]|nr:galactose mutarotase [Lachnospiraceae bacterium]